ncbi:hypothetical protein FRC02_003246 [Tulasnella sp. 418]|nr:hypothetical protein FRC02_003246 [Tulasnella sp. 418]
MAEEFTFAEVIMQMILKGIDFITAKAQEYDFDPTNPSAFIPIIVSLISVYFTVVSLWRTARMVIWLIFTIVKWTIMIWCLGSLFGLYLSGGKVFGWAPVVQTAISHSLQYLGWDRTAVDVGHDGLRVNGVPLTPEDLHGEGWNRFKKRSKRKPGSIFSPFDSTKKRSNKDKARSVPPDAASIAQRIIGNALDFDPAEVWQSVEAIRGEVQETFNSIRESMEVPEGAEVIDDRSWWAAWWDDDGTGESEKNRKRAKKPRQA